MHSLKTLALWNAALVLASITGAVSARAETSVSSYITCYGWLDNDPPGNGIAYPQIHSGAGGTGTYSDPVTFATDPKEYKPGTKIYIPYLKKYFIMEDSCAQCITDWKSNKRHVDLWVGGKSSSGSALINCEDSLTRTSTIIVNPTSSHTVVTTPLFNSSTKKCYVP
jgi:3D (Asp-Asp-Asp) domain-containing protein